MPAEPMPDPTLDQTPEMQFDHLGVVVGDISAGRNFLTKALGISHWTELTEDPLLGVSVQFGSAHAAGAPSGPAYELIAPLGDGSPIATALRVGKNILNHIAYLTADIASAGDRLRGEGCYPTGDAQPAIAYGGRRVQFFVSPLRFIIELIESPGHQHKFAVAGAHADLASVIEATTSSTGVPQQELEIETLIEASRS